MESVQKTAISTTTPEKLRRSESREFSCVDSDNTNKTSTARGNQGIVPCVLPCLPITHPDSTTDRVCIVPRKASKCAPTFEGVTCENLR